MSTMNGEVRGALRSAGAGETRAREAAKPVARHGGDIDRIGGRIGGRFGSGPAGIGAAFRIVRERFGPTPALVVAPVRREFRQPMPAAPARRGSATESRF